MIEIFLVATEVFIVMNSVFIDTILSYLGCESHDFFLYASISCADNINWLKKHCEVFCFSNVYVPKRCLWNTFKIQQGNLVFRRTVQKLLIKWSIICNQAPICLSEGCCRSFYQTRKSHITKKNSYNDNNFNFNCKLIVSLTLFVGPLKDFSRVSWDFL